jgi:hypothetical protein
MHRHQYLLINYGDIDNYSKIVLIITLIVWVITFLRGISAPLMAFLTISKFNNCRLKYSTTTFKSNETDP